MRVFHRFPTQHQDLIHDLCYDYYGKRIATCSSDQTIKIWDLIDNEWKLSASWKAHSGSVWKVCWAHPQFGQVIASCSFDRTVCIWEEEEVGKPWQKKATLVDSRDSVFDIQFTPRHLGLRLATCSGDGFVRIYEATDIVNLAAWPLMEEFEAEKGGANSLSWNTSPFDAPMMVVGSNESVAKVWEYSAKHRRWQVVARLEHGGAVRAVAWAANVGRTYHLIATGSKDQHVRLFKLAPDSSNKGAADPAGTASWNVRELAAFDDHKAEVWRVEWNVTGSTVASSGDDGSVRLFKADVLGHWGALSVISSGDSQ